MALDIISQRQVDIGAAQWFRPEPTTPPSNQIVVKAGVLYAGALSIIDRFTAGDQTSAAFSVVSAGFERTDLVYLDSTGAVTILQGTAVASGSAQFQGAPGYTGGPDLPDNGVPVAYVFVDETVGVTVDTTDIFQATGFFTVSRDLVGKYVDMGLIGSAPTGSSTVVTSVFSGETSGGNATTRGVVTSAPGNLVFLLDQANRTMIHAASGSRVYGRITYSATVWTLSYYYAASSGSETAVTDMSTDLTAVPTDVSIVGAPKVFSRNESGCPLFDSVDAAGVNRVLTAQRAIGFGGNGGLGNVTISANGSYNGTFNYNNLVVNSGLTLTVSTGRALNIKCQGSATVDSIFNANGTGFVGGTGATAADGTAGNVAGNAGNVGTSINGGAAGGGGGGGGGSANASTTGGTGATGGNRGASLDQAGGGTGGAGGALSTIGTAGSAATAIPAAFAWESDITPAATWSNRIRPGSGGGGGGSGGADGPGGNLSGAGGNGGRGGGLIVVEVSGDLTIGAAGGFTANGASGVGGGTANAGTSGGGGGGGGGGGAVVVMYGGTLSNSGTVTANGGGSSTGGSIGSGVAAGGAGGTGEAGYAQLFKV